MLRIAAALMATVMLATPQALAKKAYALPSYLVIVKLSAKADQQLSAEKAKVHIAAHYFGIPADAKDGDKNGEVGLGEEEADVEGSSAASFGKAQFNPRDLGKVLDGSVKVHVTVGTAKKMLSGSEISCTEFKDVLPTTALPRITITCKLNSE